MVLAMIHPNDMTAPLSVVWHSAATARVVPHLAVSVGTFAAGEWRCHGTDRVAPARLSAAGMTDGRA
jgi:hypothetical protein